MYLIFMFAFLYIIIIDMFYYVVIQSVYDVDLFYIYCVIMRFEQ